MSKKEVERKLKGWKRYRVFGQCYIGLPLDVVIEAPNIETARELVHNDPPDPGGPCEACAALEEFVAAHPDLAIFVDWDGWELNWIQDIDTGDGESL